jgi:hypothetical protein
LMTFAEPGVPIPMTSVATSAQTKTIRRLLMASDATPRRFG